MQGFSDNEWSADEVMVEAPTPVKGEINLLKQSLFVQNETCSVDTRQVSFRPPAIHLVLPCL